MGSAEDSSEDGEVENHYKAGGKRGFQTNIDDFLMVFDNTLVTGLENRLSSRGKTTYKGPLLDQSDTNSAGGEELDYTIRE